MRSINSKLRGDETTENWEKEEKSWEENLGCAQKWTSSLLLIRIGCLLISEINTQQDYKLCATVNSKTIIENLQTLTAELESDGLWLCESGENKVRIRVEYRREKIKERVWL